MAKILNPRSKKRVPDAISSEEIAPVINLLKQGLDFQVIQRRRARPYRYIGQCIVHKIDNLETENEALRLALKAEQQRLRELLQHGKTERRGVLSRAA